MKKIIAFFMTVSVFAVVMLGGCNSQNKNEKISVVCTAFAQYDWVKNILGERVGDYELTLLSDSGTDMHNYQPSVEDMVKIVKSDLFIYVGGESDKWVPDVLKQVGGNDLRTINLIEALGDRAMTEDHDHEESGDDHDHDHEEYADEHVWLSLKNAAVLCGKIADELKIIDEGFAAVYAANFENYKEKLAALDALYESAVSVAKYDTLVFGDRFPFKYFVRDYDLKYYAAFEGCSAESEASFETIVSLARAVDEFNLPAVCKIEGSNNKIAETVKNNTTSKNQLILSFNSMQSVTAASIKAGADYLSAMQDNLETLKKALGC